MKENEFFESLVNKLNAEPLPFDERDWQRMQDRLDKKRRQTIFLFLPVSLRYLSAGLAAAVVIGISLFYLSEIPRELQFSPPAEYAGEKSLSPVKKETEQESARIKNADAETIVSVRHREKRKKQAMTGSMKPLVNTALPGLRSIPEIEIAKKEEEKQTAITDHETRAGETIVISGRKEVSVWDTKYPAGNRPVFYAGGGVSYGAQALGYAVKLGLEKSLTSHLSIHTALAVNANDRNVTVSEVDKIIPTNVMTSSGNYTYYDTVYKQAHRDFAQAFVQTWVGVDYKLYRTGKLGLSVDAARLLKSREQLDDFNKELITDKTSALWNVGLRIQYIQQVAPHFDIATQYRQDISSRINKTWENNFIQLMLIYKMGRRD